MILGWASLQAVIFFGASDYLSRICDSRHRRNCRGIFPDLWTLRSSGQALFNSLLTRSLDYNGGVACAGRGFYLVLLSMGAFGTGRVFALNYVFTIVSFLFVIFVSGG